MQKLFNRRGTEQHKYRLAFRFVSILVGNVGYECPGCCHRIALQRGTKKYTTKYFGIVANTENAINESIQVKATMFYDPELSSYEGKKVQWQS